MRVLLCAATGIEMRACLQGLRSGGNCFEVIRTGVGPKAAASELRQRLASPQPRPELVISAGFAGSLHDGLPVGTWALARSIRNLNHEERELDPFLERVLRTTSLRWRLAKFLAVPAVVAGNQHSPWSAMAEVVDMESWALHEAAAAARIPFQALRMITDSPSHPIPETIALWAERRALSGLTRALTEPVTIARFFAKASSFPKQLSQGWQSVARSFDQAESAIRPSSSSDCENDEADPASAG